MLSYWVQLPSGPSYPLGGRILRKTPSSSTYDFSRIGYARRHAIRSLDDYECSSAEIAAAFGCSTATFHRYDMDVRLSRRPSQPARLHPMSPKDAREIAIISLVRAGYTKVEIADAMNVSRSTVYRQEGLLDAVRGMISPAEKRHIHRYLKDRIIDDRTRLERRRDAKRRWNRWRRGTSRFSG